MNPLECKRCGGPAQPGASACSYCGVAFSHPAGQGRPAEVGTAATVGQLVIGRWRPARFYEGKVIAHGQHRVTVAWLDGSSPSEVALDEAFPVPDDLSTLQVGEFVLAKWGSTTRWYGATVTAISAHRISVRYADDMTGECFPDQVVRIPDATEAELRADAGSSVVGAAGGVLGGMLESLQMAVSGVEASDAAPPVYRPYGWSPAPGQRVTAIWRTAIWYTGTVQGVTAEGAIVAWDDGSSPSPVAFDRVAPLPDASTPPAAMGQRVLVAPASGTAWVFGAVVNVAQGACEVALDDGTRRWAYTGQYLPIA